MGLNQTPIPVAELDVFRQLPDLEVVVDVGARTDMDYLTIHPGAEFHLFEPNPDFYTYLQEQTRKFPNVHVSPVGLADKEGTIGYNNGRQAFVGGECPGTVTDRELPVMTLDQYAKAHGLTRIDFLKVDVEGYDYKVLLGAQKSLKISRFIQYEYWNDLQEFEELLGKEFELVPTGYRNVLGMNKRLVPVSMRKRVREYVEDRKYGELI